jgi:uncharacterized repeat protein (TIGR01451 family)
MITRTKLTARVPLLLGAFVLAAAVSASGVLATSSALAASPAASPTAKPNTAPQLSIAITDNRGATARGDALKYTIVVKNVGTTGVHALAVTQNVPQGMTFATASSAGSLKASTVSWTTNIRASGQATFVTTMKVGTAPKYVRRLATVACALGSPSGPPIVCASDSDQLPTRASAVGRHAHPQGFSVVWWIVGGSVILVLLMIGLAIVLVSRRRARSR